MGEEGVYYGFASRPTKGALAGVVPWLESTGCRAAPIVRRRGILRFMATTKRKPREKIPYIGKPLTASEFKEKYPLPPEHQAYLDQKMPAFLEKIRRAESRKRRSSPKTARAK
jgi:hypothetical protein